MSYDITAWQLVDGYVIPQFDDGGYAEDMFDVLQRVLCAFLTETGSVRYTCGRKSERACPFMSAWRRGEIASETDIYRIFGLCRSYIKTAMETQESRYDPPERRFKDLKLRRVIVYPGSVQLECRLETRADTLEFKLPLPL